MRIRSSILVFAAAAQFLPGAASALDLLASDKAIVDSGHALYQQHCAKCHGADGAGGSAQGLATTVKTPSLNDLAKRKGGVFPFWELYEMISGSELLPAHGGRTMPIWSQELAKAPKINKADAQAIVRGRIVSILAYLSTIQEK